MNIHEDAQNADAKMRPETEKRLMLLLYHPRHSSDPDGLLRLARELLGMPKLSHATVMDIVEADAVRLISALERAFPDRSAGIASRTADDLKNRLV